MAKHPVPKRKTSNSRVRKRYGAFQFQARRKLEGQIKLVPCSNCGAQKRVHHVCATCGNYRGRQVINKNRDLDNVTTIKA